MTEDEQRIEIWKVARQAVQSSIDDRNTQTKIYTTLIFSIYAALGFLLKESGQFPVQCKEFGQFTVYNFALLGLPGLATWICCQWEKQMATFWRSIGARYLVLREIEKKMLEKPFTRDKFYRKKIKKQGKQEITSSLAVKLPKIMRITGILTLIVMLGSIVLSESCLHYLDLIHQTIQYFNER